MTATLIALVSIFFGILGANIFAKFKTDYSFDLTGNTIAGVFGSIFFIKSFGRLGFAPQFIAFNGDFNINIFILNLIVSLIGGAIALYFIKKLYIYMNKA